MGRHRVHCVDSPAAGSPSYSMSSGSSCEQRGGPASSGLKHGKNLVKSILELAAQGHFDDAIALCNAQLSTMTSNASAKRKSSTRALCEALSLRSSLFIKKQELQSALADAETAVALDSDYCQGYYCKAVALCEMGRYSDSLEFLQAALKLTKSKKHAEFLQQCIDLVVDELLTWEPSELRRLDLSSAVKLAADFQAVLADCDRDAGTATATKNKSSTSTLSPGVSQSFEALFRGTDVEECASFLGIASAERAAHLLIDFCLTSFKVLIEDCEMALKVARKTSSPLSVARSGSSRSYGDSDGEGEIEAPSSGNDSEHRQLDPLFELEQDRDSDDMSGAKTRSSRATSINIAQMRTLAKVLEAAVTFVEATEHAPRKKSVQQKRAAIAQLRNRLRSFAHAARLYVG